MVAHSSIDHTGLTGIGLPAFHGVRLARASGNFSVGNNTLTAVEFTTEVYDTDSMHDNSTNPSRITIPAITGVTTGAWLMQAHGYVTGQTIADVLFRIGGTTQISFERHSNTIGTFGGMTTYVLSAAQYIEVLVRTPAGAGSVVHDAGISPIVTVSFLGKVT